MSDSKIKIINLFLIFIFIISGFIGIFEGIIEKGEVSANRQTYVSWIISENTTWTEENNPYRVKGDILVDKNTTLIIQPGVIIKFDNKYSITIDGTLIAQGSQNKMITFTINEETNIKGEWAQLLLSDNPHNRSIIEYCRFENADKAVKLKNKFPNTLPIFQNNIIANSGGLGIYYEYYDDYVKINGTDKIVNNTFNNIRGDAIELYPYLRNNNIITKNNYTLLIKNNFISGSNNAIEINDAGVNIEIYNNTIFGNEKGIYIDIDSNGRIKNTCWIKNNVINSNKYGFEISYWDSTVTQWDEEIILLNNTIANNDYGIYLAPGNVKEIRNNNIHNNSIFNVFHVSPKKFGDFDLCYNWWGTTNITEINDSIHDYYDDWNLGKINYIPFLTKPNLNTPELKLNQPPIANAGPNQTAVIKQIVYFIGNGSNDPEGDILNYKWEFGDETSTYWQNENNTFHSYELIGNYTVTLKINDGEFTTFDTCFVSVFDNNNVTNSSDTNDIDGDGMPDFWEENHDLDKNDPNDANSDNDNDGLLNIDEYNNYTNPQRNDSDADGLSDGDEIKIYKTSPVHVDTDGDDYYDGVEIDENSDPLDDKDIPKRKDNNDLNEDNTSLVIIISILISVILIILLLVYILRMKDNKK